MRKEGLKIIEEFEKSLGLYENFRISSLQLIKTLVEEGGVFPHQVTARTKDKTSLENKIISKDYKYKSLQDITDVVGIRVVTYFEDEIDQVAKQIEKEFVIDKVNSVDKRILESDKFGYLSLHYVISYSASRLKLPEYSKFKNLKLEIQIRSILQHSWAEIEHDIGYKGENEIPDSARRTFYRVAALLEQADIEFVKLKNEIHEYERTIDEKVKNKPEFVAIDKASLLSYIQNSTKLKALEQEVATSSEGLTINSLEKHEEFIGVFLQKLKELQLPNLAEVDALFDKHKDAALRLKTKHMEKDDISGFIEGASLLWVLDLEFLERLKS